MLSADGMGSDAHARRAGLRYVNDESPGISRTRQGDSFRYTHPRGAPVRQRATLERIRRLAIPPAWTEVWICPQANGHIQATGRDARGRKQYRYHERWREVRDEDKYGRTLALARALPALRRRIARDLQKRGLPRPKVLAAIVRLMELTCIRVGNESYARENGSYGLTTLRNEHVRVEGGRVLFRFRGKSGKDHEITLADRRLAGIVRKCLALPGEEAFQYVAEDGSVQRVDSSLVNDYLRRVAGDDFSAKDLRTWSGTVLAAHALRLKTNLKEALKTVAKKLGNTPAVCRKAYVHPHIIAAFLRGKVVSEPRRTEVRGLTRDEHAVVTFLRETPALA